MSLPRLLLIACLGLLWMFAPSRAMAATTCTATMTDLAFGPVNEQQVVPTTATIDYECNTTTIFAYETSVRLCLGIGAGSGSGSTVNQRYMRNSQGDPLNFRITHDPTASSNWGNTAGTWQEVPLTYDLSGGFFNRRGRGEGQITVYGQVPAQSGLAAGSYTSTFNDTQLVYRYQEISIFGGTDPTSCTTGGQDGGFGTFPFTARATVPGSCTLQGATDLNFGSLLSTSTGLIEKSSTISLSCTRRTAWQIGLDNGKHWNGSSRRLQNGSAYINYELYRSAGWDRWGNTLNADTRTGTGTGVTELVTVHGRITNQPLTQAGRYGDTIKVTVTY